MSAQDEPFSEKTLEFLKNAAVDSGATAYLYSAFKIDQAVHEMCMVRNGLNKKDEKYATKYAIMQAAIKIMTAEGNKAFDTGTSYVQARQTNKSEHKPADG
jgi:hypothetical protein